MTRSIQRPPLLLPKTFLRKWPASAILIKGIASLALLGAAAAAVAHPTAVNSKQRAGNTAQAHKHPQGSHQVGYASYYANKFSGRRMADGTPMRPESDNAASLRLPLGSKALVTNLRNGLTAVVTIRDRGPFAKGRIIDVSPSTARLLGMLHAGVVKVTVTALDDLPRQEKIDAVIASADSSEPADKETAP